MPLLQTAESKIGTVFLTDTAATGGRWVWTEWADWSTRTRKVKTTTYGTDGTPYVTNTGVGLKGPVTLQIPSCPATLYDALKALADTTTHYTTVLQHAQLGTKTFTAEVIDVIAPTDEQWVAGDPVLNVTVRLTSFGV